MSTETLVVDIESDDIDIEELQEKYEIIVKVSPESEPIEVPLGKLKSVQ